MNQHVEWISNLRGCDSRTAGAVGVFETFAGKILESHFLTAVFSHIVVFGIFIGILSMQQKLIAETRQVKDPEKYQHLTDAVSGTGHAVRNARKPRFKSSDDVILP